MKKSLVILSVLLLFSGYFTLAQTNKKSIHSKHVVYADNINDPLSASELKMIQEVYGAQSEELILNNSQRLKDVKNILRHRVEIVEVPNKDLSSFKKLSSIPLYKEYNSALMRDMTINRRTFNPLKYQFPFFSKESLTVRVDNTPYLIHIKSQFE